MQVRGRAWHLARALLLPLALAVASAGAAAAETYPSRVITLISPYPPGGVTSDTARLIAEGLQARLGQPVIVENVGGAGATMGVARVARAAPDGYTLLIHNMAVASSVSLFKNLPYDARKDLAGIALLNTSPLILVGRKSLPPTTLPELLAWFKTKPTVRFAAPGIGNIGHLCGTLVSRSVEVPFDMIPYRGGAPAQLDLLAGHIDMTCSTSQGVVEPIKSGLLKGFGVTSAEPYEPLPELASLPNAGFPKLGIRYWHGMYAPARTPPEVIAKLNAAVRAVLADPKTAEQWRKLGIAVYEPAGQTPEAATAYLHQEIERWAEVIRENRIEGPQ
ncbi:MAG: tripartite tricarboxylate transporter substrate binding protein BugD [Variibacter sp.]|nr:tripartite tricarboxylate transporter substrate binding protein BugD [Variibacter sp.]